MFYVRSSKGSVQALNHQINELTEKFGEPKNVYRDSASGLSEKRCGLDKMINDAQRGKFNTICISHEDRLTRFGFSYLEKLFRVYNVKIKVLHKETNQTIENELMSDLMALIASFAGRFYRLRSNEAKLKLLDGAKNEILLNKV